MVLTRKHMEHAATLVRSSPDLGLESALAFAEFFTAYNPTFDYERFMDAAGFKGE